MCVHLSDIASKCSYEIKNVKGLRVMVSLQDIKRF